MEYYTPFVFAFLNGSIYDDSKNNFVIFGIFLEINF